MSDPLNFINVADIRGQDTWQYIDDNFLNVCRNKSVVEIGPYDGWISERILNHCPQQLTLVEARKQSADMLQLNPKLKSCNVLLGDMHYDLDQVGQVDVAIALGVIYHSHAPLLMLEELVNWCNPQSILLDNPGQILKWLKELANAPGMRHTVTDRKTCGIVIEIGEELLIAAMINLGYQLHWKQILPGNLSLKANWPVYQFEKNNG
jgi:hypothetical protein